MRLRLESVACRWCVRLRSVGGSTVTGGVGGRAWLTVCTGWVVYGIGAYRGLVPGPLLWPVVPAVHGLDLLRHLDVLVDRLPHHTTTTPCIAREGRAKALYVMRAELPLPTTTPKFGYAASVSRQYYLGDLPEDGGGHVGGLQGRHRHPVLHHLQAQRIRQPLHGCKQRQIGTLTE